MLSLASIFVRVQCRLLNTSTRLYFENSYSLFFPDLISLLESRRKVLVERHAFVKVRELALPTSKYSVGPSRWALDWPKSAGLGSASNLKVILPYVPKGRMPLVAFVFLIHDGKKIPKMCIDFCRLRRSICSGRVYLWSANYFFHLLMRLLLRLIRSYVDWLNAF